MRRVARLNHRNCEDKRCIIQLLYSYFIGLCVVQIQYQRITTYIRKALFFFLCSAQVKVKENI